MISTESQISESKKKTVNKAIRICVDCGSTAVLIANYGIFCKDCNSKFSVEKDKLE